jgi:hypothetical protein
MLDFNLMASSVTGIFAGNFHRVLFLLLLMISITACGDRQKSQSSASQPEPVAAAKATIEVPVFNADSAYFFVGKQLSFGPRVPGSDAHAACVAWLERKMETYTGHIVVQEFKTRVYNKEIFDGKNIIASFNPEKQARLFLSAHWDSRPYADHDPDPAKHQTPIDGANDGASGTGILIEIARILSNTQPDIGIDIILFDLEDYGPPQDNQTNQSTETWGLGSQYWSRNPHVPGYSPRYGILLDMVGASDAVFPLEGFSMYYAPDIIKKVWNIAENLGYGDYFVFDQGAYITDDHYFINSIAQIPTINIIHLDPASPNGTFYEHWHTVKDNLDQIDPVTLKVVGQTVLEVIFRE